MKTIMHIDMNSFYASCEMACDRERYSPDTRLVVTGNPDARCGVVLACSGTAKQFGVKAGMTISEASAICPDAVFVKARFPLYFKMSRRVMNIICCYSPVVEQYGLDEAYVDFTGCEKLFGSATEAAHMIRERIKRETGLTCSVGVAPNKLLAKMGSDYKKPDAVTVIDYSNFKTLVWPLPVNDLIFVGRQTNARLKELGIQTVEDLAKTPVKTLKQAFGIMGAMLWMNANGLDDTPVREEPESIKGIGNSSTLPGDAENLDEIKVMLLVHSEQVGKRLREARKMCRTVQVVIKGTDLKTRHHQKTLANATDLTEDIYSISVKLVKEIWRGEKVRLVGVRVTMLSHANGYHQLSLFSQSTDSEKKKLELCIDSLRERFGNNCVFRGTLLAEGIEQGTWYEDVFFN